MSFYGVEEATKREDLDAIVDVIWAAMDGTDPSHQIFYPVFGGSDADRQTAIQTSKERMWQEHVGDPSSTWIAVRDNASGIVLGGCQWRVYTQNPFPNGTPEIEASWWPEGEGRAFASEVVKQCYTLRTLWMARPHVGRSTSSTPYLSRFAEPYSGFNASLNRSKPHVCTSRVSTPWNWKFPDGLGT